MHPSNKITVSSLFLVALLLQLDLSFPLGHLDQLGHIEPVHVVHMRVYSTCLPQVRMEPLLNKLDKPLLTDLILDIHHLHEPLLRGKVNHFFVLQGRH